MAKKVVKKKAKKTVKKAPVKKNKIDVLERRAKKELDALKKKFMATEKRVRSSIKKHPEKAVAIAAGVGAAIGTAVTAAMRKSKKKKKK